MKTIRASIVITLCVGASLLVGCSSSQTAQRDAPAPDAAVLAGLESIPADLGKKDTKDHRVAYTIGPDDVLRVEVRQHPEIGGEFLVSPEGEIFISLIGSVAVEDATTGEIAGQIQRQLGEYVRDPEVAVSVTAYNSKKVYVLGQVAKPGEYPMEGNVLSVRDAVVDAGLPLGSANLPQVVVITPDEYNPQAVLVDLDDILYRGIMRENIDLKPGDVVVVHRNVLAKLGAFLEQILGPTARVRSLEELVDTFED